MSVVVYTRQPGKALLYAQGHGSCLLFRVEVLSEVDVSSFGTASFTLVDSAVSRQSSPQQGRSGSFSEFSSGNLTIA